jgi:hypothetical protein
VLVRRGDTTVHVTGHSKSGQVTATLDGQPAEILYPPVSSEE